MQLPKVCLCGCNKYHHFCIQYLQLIVWISTASILSINGWNYYITDTSLWDFKGRISITANLILNILQWWIQDFQKGGSDLLLRVKRVQIFRSHAYFRGKPRPCRSFLRPTTSSSSPMDLFSDKFLLKHSKVSHSNSFLSSVARKGGDPFSLTSVYFLVLGAAAKGGFLCTPGYPSESATERQRPTSPWKLIYRGVWHFFLYHVRTSLNFGLQARLSIARAAAQPQLQGSA